MYKNRKFKTKIWLTNNCNTHIAQYLKNKGSQTKFGQLIEYDMNIFVEKSYIKCAEETIPRPLSKK